MHRSILSRPKSFILCLVTPDRGHYQREAQGLISYKDKRNGKAWWRREPWWEHKNGECRNNKNKGIERRVKEHTGEKG